MSSTKAGTPWSGVTSSLLHAAHDLAKDRENLTAIPLLAHSRIRVPYRGYARQAHTHNILEPLLHVQGTYFWRFDRVACHLCRAGTLQVTSPDALNGGRSLQSSYSAHKMRLGLFSPRSCRCCRVTSSSLCSSQPNPVLPILATAPVPVTLQSGQGFPSPHLFALSRFRLNCWQNTRCKRQMCTLIKSHGMQADTGK